MVETPNDEAGVVYLTLSMDGELDGGRRAAIDNLVRSERGCALWRASASAGRSYALLELPDTADRTAIRAAFGATVYDRPVIALAVFPTVPEALLPLREALGAAGRPAGVLACRDAPGGVVVEWDPGVTGVDVVMALVDVELARFHSGRAAELLSPLPPALVAEIAAKALEAPQVEPRRILEMRIEGA
jgi:hypothetical protein